MENAIVILRSRKFGGLYKSFGRDLVSYSSKFFYIEDMIVKSLGTKRGSSHGLRGSL